MGPLAQSVATMIIALPFLVGRALGVREARWRRALVSVAAGVSLSYAFVDLLPELAEMQAAFVEALGDVSLLFAEQRVYLWAFLGFIAFHYLEVMAVSSRDPGHDQHHGHGEGERIFRVHIIGFALYVGLIAYLLGAKGEERGSHYLAFYSAAMALHFLLVDHSLRKEHGARYDAMGRWVLLGAVWLGYAVSIFAPLPVRLIAGLMGFVAGGVILNSIKDELPAEGEGQILPLLAGGIGYSLLLLLA